MAGGREFSKHQKKIIDRYYEHHDTIVAQRLGELVGDIALAAGNEKKLDTLWKRVETQLGHTSLNPAEVGKVLASRDAAGLGRLVARLAR
jgi:hypothetical protein